MEEAGEGIKRSQECVVLVMVEMISAGDHDHDLGGAHDENHDHGHDYDPDHQSKSSMQVNLILIISMINDEKSGIRDACSTANIIDCLLVYYSTSLLGPLCIDIKVNIKSSIV